MALGKGSQGGVGLRGGGGGEGAVGGLKRTLAIPLSMPKSKRGPLVLALSGL